jgi:parallel beta-helix repeat protein
LGAVAVLLSGCALLAGLGLAGPAAAAKLEVFPGKNTINRAVKRGHRGDTLRIHKGHYRESLKLEKRGLKLVGVGRGRPVIDGECEAVYTVMVRAPNVVLDHLKVVGADGEPFPSEVDFSFIPSGTARDLVVRDTCDAEYGINVFQAGAIQLIGNEARGGFTDAGIYVGAITSTGSGVLRVKRNETYANNRGIIVEQSAGGEIRVSGNSVHDNTIGGEGVATGIYVNVSDEVLFFNNRVLDNGTYGVHLTPNSDGNLFLENVITGNPTDYFDQGAGNCGSGNMLGNGSIPPCS